jgi:autotransporter-associated beta strand protein
MDLGGYSVTKSGSGTLALPGSGGLTLQNGTLTLNRGSTTTTNVSGGYKITATNTFNLIVNSGASFSTGASAGSYEWNANTTISGGTVTLGNTSGGGTFGGTFTLSDGGRLNLGGTTGSVTISNAIQIAGGTSTLAISNSSQYNTTKLNGGIKGNGTLNISSGKDITISGIQDQSGALAINMTSGTLTFGGTNNYSGGTTLSGGTLNISGSLTGGGDFIIKNGTTANFNQGSTVTINTGNSLVVGQETSGTSGRTLNANGTVINAGTLNVGRNGILNLNEGVNWTQTGEFNIKGNGGYGATANLNAGIITYTGTSTIHLNAIDGSNASGSSTLNISGGTLATSQGFTFTTGTSSTSAQGKVIFSNG